MRKILISSKLIKSLLITAVFMIQFASQASAQTIGKNHITRLQHLHNVIHQQIEKMASETNYFELEDSDPKVVQFTELNELEGYLSSILAKAQKGRSCIDITEDLKNASGFEAAPANSEIAQALKWVQESCK